MSRGSMIMFVGLLPAGRLAAEGNSSLSESKIENTDMKVTVAAMFSQDEELRRQLSLARRGNLNIGFPPFAAAGNFHLQPLDALARVQAQILGIGANESDGVGAPGYGIEFALLQGVQIVLADLQDARDFCQIFALALSRLAQILTDGLQGGVGIVRYFAQVQTAAFEPAALIEGKSCDLWHVACCIAPVQTLKACNPKR